MEVVEDAGVGAGSLDVGLQGGSFEGGVAAVDQAFAGGIADRGFIKAEVVGEDFGDFGTDQFIAGADLAAEGRERATADVAGDGVAFFLVGEQGMAITAEALQGGHEGGEDFVQAWQVLRPGCFDGGNGEVGFRFEEVIEAAFADFGTRADVIHTGGSIAVFPNEIVGGLDKVFFGVAGSCHRGAEG